MYLGSADTGGWRYTGERLLIVSLFNLFMASLPIVPARGDLADSIRVMPGKTEFLSSVFIRSQSGLTIIDPLISMSLILSTDIKEYSLCIFGEFSVLFPCDPTEKWANQSELRRASPITVILHDPVSPAIS